MLLYIESVNAKGVPFSGLKYKGASKWLGDLSLLFKKTGNIKWPKTKTSIDTHFGIYHRKCQHIFIRKESKINIYIAQETYSSVQLLSHVNSLRPHGLHHARPTCPSPTPRVYPNSCPLSPWFHPTISSFVIPFSSHLQPFPASGYFSMSQLFASGGQSIGVSASTSVLPMNIQDWSPLGRTGWISLQSKGLSRGVGRWCLDTGLGALRVAVHEQDLLRELPLSSVSPS